MVSLKIKKQKKKSTIVERTVIGAVLAFTLIMTFGNILFLGLFWDLIQVALNTKGFGTAFIAFECAWLLLIFINASIVYYEYFKKR